jgi:hypothetical protein
MFSNPNTLALFFKLVFFSLPVILSDAVNIPKHIDPASDV